MPVWWGGVNPCVAGRSVSLCGGHLHNMSTRQTWLSVRPSTHFLGIAHLLSTGLGHPPPPAPSCGIDTTLRTQP
jgi:hypothetical protein